MGDTVAKNRIAGKKKAGAGSFLTKPINEQQLLLALNDAMSRAKAQHHQCSTLQNIAERYARHTHRECDVFMLLTRR